MEKKYEAVLESAVLGIKKEDKIGVYIYSNSRLSFTAEIASELLYLFPEKLIIVGRVSDGRVKMSLRSNRVDIPKILKKVLEGIEGTGGGHEKACGSNVSQDDFPEFKKRLETYLNNQSNFY